LRAIVLAASLCSACSVDDRSPSVTTPTARATEPTGPGCGGSAGPCPQGTGGQAGTGGQVPGPGGSATDAAGSGSSEDGEGTVSTQVHTAPDAATDICTKLLFFRDRDGDGYGSDAEGESELRCPAEGWAARGGDCFDADPSVEIHAAEVHPGQTAFFSEGYPRQGQPGEVSFDYDCVRGEEADPSSRAAPLGDCSSATPPSCGTFAGTVRSERSGPGVNALCGSGLVQVCNQIGADQCQPQVLAAPDAFRCH
jgi:hypothetical protein